MSVFLFIVRIWGFEQVGSEMRVEVEAETSRRASDEYPGIFGRQPRTSELFALRQKASAIIPIPEQDLQNNTFRAIFVIYVY